jgi:hypothetical protein
MGTSFATKEYGETERGINNGSIIVGFSLEFWYRARERITFIKRNCISTIHPYSRASFQVPLRITPGEPPIYRPSN